MKIIESPNHSEERFHSKKSLFMAGSIEMGKAVDWQTEFAAKLSDMDINIYNPRRKDWDSSWEQSIHNKQFSEQVNWELNYIDQVDLVVFYFQAGTMSPITLAELGLVAGSYKHAIVFCEEGFWRKGNVDIICSRSDRILTASCLDDLASKARFILQEY